MKASEDRITNIAARNKHVANTQQDVKLRWKRVMNKTKGDPENSHMNSPRGKIDKEPNITMNVWGNEFRLYAYPGSIGRSHSSKGMLLTIIL